MSYKLYLRTGLVVRDIDNVVVAPCDDPDSLDYQDYITWVNLGNSPELISAPTPEELLEEAKRQREIQVSQIIVTTQSGRTFNGDEDSQNRMARAIVAMNETDTVSWVLADDQVVQATRAELQEALYLAGQAQAAIWIAPYQ